MYILDLALKTNLDLLKKDSEWQWYQLDHMQICTSLQTYDKAIHSFFTDRMPSLPTNQQR